MINAVQSMLLFYLESAASFLMSEPIIYIFVLVILLFLISCIKRIIT